VASRTALAAGRRRRWLALTVLAGSQLLIVLDATIVNVALTAIRADLGLSPVDLQWVITAYVLAFGGLLLLGGRLADRFGRRRVFIAGAAAFGIGSVIAGVAGSASLLIGGRAMQGAAAAMLAPAALSLLMTVFPEGPDRHRALGVWGGVSASGMTLGLVLGGTLTQALSWHWVFWINVPVTAAAVVCARAVLPTGRVERPEPFDVAGALLVTAGLGGLVFGLVRTAEPGPGPGLPVLVAAVAVLAWFARRRAVRSYALVPTRLLRNPSVRGGNLVGLMLGAVVYSLFYFLSVFMGEVLDYGPVRTGLAFLPMTAAIAAASAAAGRLLGRTGPRPLLVMSSLLVIAALVNLTRVAPDSGYAGTLLPAFLLAGTGLGLSFVALTAAAVGAAPAADSGVAAALFNAGQQVGGALGLAGLTAVAAARTTSLSPPGTATAPASAITAGWSLGFWVSAGVILAGLVVVITMIRPGAPGRAAAAGAADGRPAVAAVRRG
jgi:EmrB/QacA subfamily drug resistance transporter